MSTVRFCAEAPLEKFTPAKAGVFYLIDYPFYLPFIDHYNILRGVIMFDNMFEKFHHEVTNVYLWIIILLVGIRGVYSCAKKRDYVHLAAFAAVIVIAAYFTAAGFGWLPAGFEEELFG